MMSQSHNAPDTQGLLQSMLQRLRLQPGREGQPLQHSPSQPLTAASSQPVNGLGLGTDGIPSDEFGFSAVDNLDIKGGEIQQESDGCGMDTGLVSLPSRKDNSDKDTGENRVLGVDTSPRIPPAGTGQSFPAKPLKGADVTSFEGTGGERGAFVSSAVTGHGPALTNSGQNQIQDLEKFQSFVPKVYTWSLKPTHAGPQGSKVFQVGNGEFGASAQSKEIQFVASGQTTTNGGSRRKQRSSENKTRRWTQKIKERWMDRQGSSDKKDGGTVNHNSEQGTEASPQRQPLPAEHLVFTSHQENEGTLVSLDSSDGPPPHTGDGSHEERYRPSGDFELGLGSFSLLEEIVTGQEWARFLNPNLPSEEPPSQLKSPLNPYDCGPSSLILNQQGDGNNLRSVCGPESPPGLDLSRAQISPDRYSQPVSMDVLEGKQQQYGGGASFVERADILDNPTLKRVHLNRKRQHRSADRDVRMITDETASTSSLSTTSSHVMDEPAESQQDVLMPLNPLNSPPAPLSPFKPFAPGPRGVLKHFTSLESEPSMETVTKRRRVEENRRVRFAEEVVTIDPPQLDVDAEDSEEDFEAEDDSVIEQDWEVEQAEMEEEAAAAAAAAAAATRRSVLPAWIQALKRRSTGRKHRL